MTATNRGRHTSRSQALVGLVVVLALWGPTVAGAQTSGGGVLGPDYVRADARDLGAGTFSGASIPTAAPSATSPYAWERLDSGAMCVVFDGPIPPEFSGSLTLLPGIFPFPAVYVAPIIGAPAGAVRVERNRGLPSGGTYVGDLVVDVATPVASDREMLVLPRCALPGAALPPAPPSAAEIWQQTPLPRATIHADPPGTRTWPGIVRMESRFWADALPDAHVVVSLGGFDVSVVAHPTAYAWWPGDGSVVVGPGPGSVDSPVRARFTRRGEYRVTVFVVWTAFAHTTAPALGLDFGDQFLGTVTLPEHIGYHEAEVRALLHS